VKLDYIAFTDDHFDKPGDEDDGLYIGLEGYARIIQNLYLGERSGELLILIYREKTYLFSC